MNGNRLYRSTSEAKVGGVAAGLGNYFKLDPTIFRIIFVGATIFTGGSFILVYLALWLLLPTAASKASDVGGVVRENLDEIGSKLRGYTNSGNNSGSTSTNGQNGNAQQSSTSGGAPTTPVSDYKTVQEAQAETPQTTGQNGQKGHQHMGLLPILLIVFGIIFLLGSFHPMYWAGPKWGWGFFIPWPLILIAVAFFVLKGRRVR